MRTGRQDLREANAVDSTADNGAWLRIATSASINFVTCRRMTDPTLIIERGHTVGFGIEDKS